MTSRRAIKQQVELHMEAARIEQALKHLPEIPGDSSLIELHAAQQRRWACVEEILEELGAEGATFKLGPYENRLRYLGVAVSSTRGAEGLLRNWVKAARNRPGGTS